MHTDAEKMYSAKAVCVRSKCYCGSGNADIYVAMRNMISAFFFFFKEFGSSQRKNDIGKRGNGYA